jgi:predicted secreted hydrolase
MFFRFNGVYEKMDFHLMMQNWNFLNSGTKNLKSIHLKFKLENFQEKIKLIHNRNFIIKDFYKISFKSYRGTSFEALKKNVNWVRVRFNLQYK